MFNFTNLNKMLCLTFRFQMITIRGTGKDPHILIMRGVSMDEKDGSRKEGRQVLFFDE